MRRRLGRKQTDRVFGRNEARSSPWRKPVGVPPSEYSMGSPKRQTPTVESIAVLMNDHTESRPSSLVGLPQPQVRGLSVPA